MRSLLATSLLIACSTTIDEVESSSEPSSETESASSETESTPSEETESASEELVFRIDRDSEEPLRLALGLVTDEGVASAWETFPIEGGVALVEIPAPPEEHIQTIGDGGFAMDGAVYAPYLFVDADGDGEHGPGEVVRGVGPAVVGWFRDVPAEAAFFGFREGWNALSVEGQFPVVLPLDDIPLELNLLPTLSITAGGAPPEDYDLTDRAVAVIPTPVFAGSPVEELLVDQPLTDPFTLLLHGPPPEDHLDPDSELPGMAFEVPSVYLRGEVDGWPGEAPEEQQPLCFGGDPVLFTWLPEPTDPNLGFGYLQMGLQPGWVLSTPELFEEDSEAEPLTEEQAMNLEIDPDCEFPSD